MTDADLPTMRAAWETHAGDWAAWARTPGHDHFFWNLHSYSQPRRFVDQIERDGFTMEFHSMHRPLAAYTDALHDAGFVIELLREPVPDAAAIAEYPRFGRQDRIPSYLHLRATRTARPAVSMLKGG